MLRASVFDYSGNVFRCCGQRGIHFQACHSSVSNHDPINSEAFGPLDVEECSPSAVHPLETRSRLQRQLGSVRKVHGTTLAASAASGPLPCPAQTDSDVVRVDNGNNSDREILGVEGSGVSSNPEFSLKTDDICFNCSVSRFEPGKVLACPAKVPNTFDGWNLRGLASSGEKEDPTRKLKQEFEAARRCFEHIPSALHGLPKMDPNGKALHDWCHSLQKMRPMCLSNEWRSMFRAI